MQIFSSLLPAHQGVILMVFDATVDGRRMLVGLGQGQVVDGDPRLTPVGERCINHLVACNLRNHPQGAVRIMVVKSLDGVAQRMAKAFAAAGDGDATFFLCTSSAIYDAVYQLMNLQPGTDQMAPH